MPTYKNNTTDTIVYEGISFPPGIEKSMYKYVYHPDLTFIKHAPRVFPFRTLYEGTIGGSTTLTGMSRYEELVVYNNSGNDLVITPNADSGNTMSIPQGDRRTFTINNRWYSISFSGSGAGNIYVYAVEEGRV
jgi:hypothetical protein